MDSVQHILLNLFGGEITVDKVTTMAVGAYAVVKSFTEWRAKAKLIKAEKQLTATDKQLQDQKKELEDIKSGLSSLGEMLCVAYLANPNVEETTKKKIAVAATNLESISNVALTKTTTTLLESVTTYVPGTNISAQKQAIDDAAKTETTKVTTSAEETNSIIEQLEV